MFRTAPVTETGTLAVAEALALLSVAGGAATITGWHCLGNVWRSSPELVMPLLPPRANSPDRRH